ncbi:MAG: hypothetical protein HQL51_08735 [Magnetococcales bacterium]|nr:hypothetical protein [Magnetococcales bacterium]
MDPRIAKLKTTEECVNFENNATERGFPEIAADARRRGIAIRAEKHGAASEAERECLEAVYAHERMMLAKNGRTTRAIRTWQTFNRQGIIVAVEQLVSREAPPSGYTLLADLGLADYAFEAVVLRHPEAFSPEAVKRSQERMEQRLTQPAHA